MIRRERDRLPVFSAPGREATLRQLSGAGVAHVETRTVDAPPGSSAAFVFATRGCGDGAGR